MDGTDSNTTITTESPTTESPTITGDATANPTLEVQDDLIVLERLEGELAEIDAELQALNAQATNP